MFFNDWGGIGRTLIAGVVAYVGIIVFVRLSGKRSLSKMNAFDFIITVALGSTLATILLSKDVALAEGLTAFALLVGLQFVITWLSVRTDAVHVLVKSEPALLAFRGRILDDSLREQRVSEVEVLQAIRQHGSASIGDVHAVILETDGSFSVIGEAPAGDGDSALRNVVGWREETGG